MVELVKGLIFDKDLDAYDGTLATSRTSSSGGTTSGLKIGDAVDVLRVYGSSDTDNQTRATINTATGALGSQNVALLFRPGTWTIDDDLTIASNFTLVVPAGCVFNVSAGKTLTIQGILFRQHNTYTSGSGTVTVSGTDLLAASTPADDYAVDTGAADAYVVSLDSNPSSYTAGMVVRFKPANDNTGASTINVNSLGNKDIKKTDGSTDPDAGEIKSGEIVTLIYEGVNGVFHIDNNHDLNGAQLILDDDGDTSITVDTDDRVDLKVQGQDLFRFDGTTASSVNGLDFVGQAAGSATQIKAQGSDTNISLDIVPKGTGSVQHSSVDIGAIGTVQVFTSSDTWNRPSGCKIVRVMVVGGGGGGGGGAATGASEGACGGGGGGGGQSTGIIDVSGISSSTITVGGGGSGGSAGNNSGSNGSNSSWSDGTNTLTGNGGSGGGGSAAGSVPNRGGIGGAGGGSSGGDINANGSPGQTGMVFSNSGIGGGGGSSPGFGGGAVASGTNGAGGTGNNYGGGGSGAGNGSNQSARAGGNGSAGVVVVWEYY